ncbi:hypothetical protein BOTBODRAFT_445318 [Botryobasidium botryosum FD-172 SS1]|uniref:Dolichyldiphosphatase n=1 Tax=Botryobasidium botryosum (strain FD-172 SS1) TaxID=930990 RepID=A0A067N7A8_BOTB1|nr:hypothetical protein BOTBODRAFT_445318 [Botryobasidium botryosum FD-172 SS1]
MMSSPVKQVQYASFDFTHVLYDESSDTAFILALVTLLPVLLMPAYVALVIKTRELSILTMFIGQLVNERVNWVIKRIVHQERPNVTHGDGYGFPSAHSQYMGFFSTFLILHLYHRHRFTSYGLEWLDTLQRFTAYCALLAAAGIVCYSRYYLSYHTPTQIVAGYLFGVVFALGYYHFTELNTSLRARILDSPLAQWIRLRDGWAIWADAGLEDEWHLWRAAWEKMRQGKALGVSKEQ